MSWSLPLLIVGLCFAGLVSSWPMESKSCLNGCHALLHLQLTPSKTYTLGPALTVRLITIIIINLTPVILKLNLFAMNTCLLNLYKTAKIKLEHCNRKLE